jgi:lactoylglutathione lyase
MNNKILPTFCFLVFSLTLLNALYAQQSDTPGPIFKLDHVALSVGNLNVSAEFYMDVFSLDEIVNRTAADGIRWFSLGEGKELHLISIVTEPVSVNKAVHFALSTQDFDRFIRMLENRGVDYVSWNGESGTVSQRADGVKQVYVRDPDGYWIEVNSTGGSDSE